MWPFKKKFDPNVTILHMRRNAIPAKFWTTRVYYDAWGEPYTVGDANIFDRIIPLKPGGATESVWDIQWKVKSGPDVTFPDSSIRDKGWFPK